MKDQNSLTPGSIAGSLQLKQREQGANNTKVLGSAPSHNYTKCIPYLTLESIWRNASVKCKHVNINILTISINCLLCVPEKAG